MSDWRRLSPAQPSAAAACLKRSAFLFALTIDKPDSVLKQLRQRDIDHRSHRNDKIVFDPRTVRTGFIN